MARSASGSYQPRCAILSDDAFEASDSLPRRAARSPRVVRGAIALGAASVVAGLALVTPGLATAAVQLPVATATPSAERPLNVEAFASRGSSADRGVSRESSQSVEDAAAQRAEALKAVGQKVADVQTTAAAQSRAAALSATSASIESEGKRLAAITFFWPTEGSITSPWGPRLHPILRYVRLHAGVDIGGAMGAPIYAVADGVVTKTATGYNGGSGNNVRIDHGQIGGEAIETGYLHMLDIEVSEGQKVKKGQRIGTVGSTGLSTAPHLHFSFYTNGNNVDPEPYLMQGR